MKKKDSKINVLPLGFLSTKSVISDESDFEARSRKKRKRTSLILNSQFQTKTDEPYTFSLIIHLLRSVLITYNPLIAWNN